jgi:hypothetical protein
MGKMGGMEWGSKSADSGRHDVIGVFGDLLWGRKCMHRLFAGPRPPR